MFNKRYWTKEERRWLLHYLDTTNHTELQQLMLQKFDKDSAIQQTDAKAAQLLSLIHQKMEADKPKEQLFFLEGRKWLMIAASVVLVLGIGIMAYIYHIPKKDIVMAVVKVPVTPGDISPGHSAAILTLSDGSTIVLDTVANGTVAQQGNSKVLKLNGQIAYRNTYSKGINEKPVYNTITTARGNQYQLVLTDGTKVWLNAASSIRFPAAFTNHQRSIEITGEAYFEVAPLLANGQKVPFVVKINTASGSAGEVHVLGTHFNINAYDDEPAIRTTLSEGKVKVVREGRSVLLQPLQQAILNRSSEQLKVQPADIEEAIAWKTGMFEFRDASLQSIVRQLSRWYDVDVSFSGAVSTKLYNGSIRRQATLSQVLQILKLAGVSYMIKGRTVTISTN